MGVSIVPGPMKIRKVETGDGTGGGSGGGGAGAGAGAGANDAATLGAQSSEILALIAERGNLESTNNMRLLNSHMERSVAPVAKKQWIQAARERVHHKHVKTFTTLFKETTGYELDDAYNDWPRSRKCNEGARALIALLKDDSTTWYNDQDYDSPTNQSIFGGGVLDARLLPRVVNDNVATGLLLKFSLWYAVEYYTHELVEALCTHLTKEMVRSPKDEEAADRDDAGGDGGADDDGGGGGLDEDRITKIMVSELPGVNIYLYEMKNKSRAIAVGRMHNTIFTYTHGDESPQWRKRPFVGDQTWRDYHHTIEEEQLVEYLAAGINAILMFSFDFSIGDRVQVLGAGGGVAQGNSNARAP